MTKIQTLITPNAGEDAEQQEFSFIAGGSNKGLGTMKKVWQFLSKHIPTIQPLCSLTFTQRN
jgi:hypothetical protein